MNTNQDVQIKIIVEGGCVADILIRGDKEPDIEIIDLDSGATCSTTSLKR